MVGGHTKRFLITSHSDLYKLLSCSPDTPNEFIMPVNAQKMQSIACIKQLLRIKAIFYALTDAIIHMFLTNLKVSGIQVVL